MTNEQEAAIRNLYSRSPDGTLTYEEFHSRFRDNTLMGCVLGTWCGMVIGIEPDGYTHS